MNSPKLEITQGSIAGVFEIQLSPITDGRGFFMRTYDAGILRRAGLDRTWVQENQSRNEQAGIIRGLHFQFPPHAETKLVRCIRGEIFDVYVDLRKGSPTFGQWGGLTLSETNRKMVLIPKGFAHGYCTLSEVSEVLYKVDSSYERTSEGGLLWSDGDLRISWPLKKVPLISDKDLHNLTLKEFVRIHGGLDVPDHGLAQ